MFSIPPISSALSGDAYQDLLQKQVDIAKKNAAAIDGMSARMDQDKKALARQRVEEIKKEIESLRKMLLLYGDSDAKAVLQQIKQLATELKQAAGVLKTSSESGVPDVTTTQPVDGYAAYAEQQASADVEASAPVPISIPAVDMQRAKDDQQVEYVTQSLKSLKAMTERLVKKHEGRL
jgi:DNA-binding FrmR family transcriptional regulator